MWLLKETDHGISLRIYIRLKRADVPREAAERNFTTDAP